MNPFYEDEWVRIYCGVRQHENRERGGVHISELLAIMWILRPLEIKQGDQHTGRWRMTATSDEDGGGPYGDPSHDHASPDEAQACEQCDDYCSKITGFMSRKRLAEIKEDEDRKEYERLKAKYG